MPTTAAVATTPSAPLYRRFPRIPALDPRTILALTNPIYPRGRAFTRGGRVLTTMSTTTETELLADRQGGILTLTFNRPRTLNSLTPAVLDALRAAVEEAATDDEVRCIVLTGTGRAFGSGASL